MIRTIFTVNTISPPIEALVVVPKGPSVRNASDDGNENLLYFSHEKLPRLQSFLSLPQNFKEQNKSFKQRRNSQLDHCGRCPVWPRIHIQIYYIRY